MTLRTTLIAVAAAMLVSTSALSAEGAADKTQIRCLAEATYHEARGEGVTGMLFVAQTVMNRTRDPRYHRNVCRVVQQKGWYHDYRSWRHWPPKSPGDKEAYANALRIAELLFRGEIVATDVERATCFHATRIRPYWAKSYDVVAREGNHVFYDCSEELQRSE